MPIYANFLKSVGFPTLLAPAVTYYNRQCIGVVCYAAGSNGKARENPVKAEFMIESERESDDDGKKKEE